MMMICHVLSFQSYLRKKVPGVRDEEVQSIKYYFSKIMGDGKSLQTTETTSTIVPFGACTVL